MNTSFLVLKNCTAAPLAPLPRLSNWAVSRVWSVWPDTVMVR